MSYCLSMNWLRLLSFSAMVAMSASSIWANNVSATREGSLIKIRGDNANNDISVVQVANGDLIIRGLSGTKVNGLASVRFRKLSLNAMDIRMEGGNDTVRIGDLNVANDLFVNLGAGSDRILTVGQTSSVGGNLTIEGGLGNDNVRLSRWTVFGDLNIQGQTGALNATLTDMMVGFGLTIIGDDLNDFVNVSNSFVGETTSIETKKGNDSVSLADLMGFDLSVDTDEGRDTLNMIAVTMQEDIEVNTGKQNDIVTFTDVTSTSKNIKVTLDVGDDPFFGINVYAELDAVFEGGDGKDTFVDGGVNGGEKLEIKDFEIFL